MKTSLHGLCEVENISANHLTQAIKDTLLRIGLKISGCRGQCYDGASNMSGIKNGVATQIAKDEKHVMYTHCYAHALNLAVGNTIKRSKVCNNALDVAFGISKLVKFFPKRNAAFDQIKAAVFEEDGFAPGIRTFCPTRWTVCGMDNIYATHGLETRIVVALKYVNDSCNTMSQ